MFSFTGSAESIPQLQEDPTQTVTTPTTAAPEHQTTIAKNTTLRKETTRPKEIGILQLLLCSL